MPFLPTKILRFTMAAPTPAANFTGPDDGWLGYPYRWSAVLAIVPQAHGSRETPTPYFYTGNDVNVGDYIVTSGRGRILKIVSIASKTTTSVSCTLEDEDRQNILADNATRGDGGIPAGEGLLFAVKNGWPILHPLPDALAGSLPAYFASDILSRFLNTRTAAVEAHASTHATAGSDPLAPGDIGAAPAASPTFTGQISIPVGSVTAPALTFTSDTNTGIYRPAADQFAVTLGGVERLLLANESLTLTGTIRAGLRLKSAYTTSATDVGVVSFINAADAVAGRFDCSSTSTGTDTRGTFRWQTNDGAGTGNNVTRALLNETGLQLDYGSAALPSLSFFSDTDTGTWRPAANTWAVSTAGVERLRVDAVGNVRLGTQTTASATLDIQGVNTEVYPIVASGLNGTSRPSIVVRNTSNTTGSFVGHTFFVNRTDATTQVASIGAVSNEDNLYAPHLVFTVRSASNNQAERMRISAAGNVGIGTNNPASRLDVSGVITVSAGTAAAPALVASGDTNTGLFFPTSDVFAVSTGGVERLRVSSDGNVAVGSAGSVNNLQLFSAGGVTIAPSAQTGSLATNALRTHISGATYAGSQIQHGILALKFPFATGTGIRFRVRGLDMQTAATAELWSFDYGIYAAASFMGSARSFHTQGLTPFSCVRVLVKNGEYFLALGDGKTLWQYPHIVADVDFFFSGGVNNDAHTLQWVAIPDDTDYALYSNAHSIILDNAYPPTGNVGIGDRTPSFPLSITKNLDTFTQHLRPYATGVVSFLVTASTTSGGNVITIATSDPNYNRLRVGTVLTGTGVAAYVTAINGSAITLSNNATGTNANITLNAVAKVSGNDQELQYRLGTTGAETPTASAGVIWLHRSYEPYADMASVPWSALFNGASTTVARTISSPLASYTETGATLAMNAVGDRIAVAFPKYSTTQARLGAVRVFQADDAYNTWNAVGAAIIGEAAEDKSGTSLAMNAAGTLVAIGAPTNAGGGTNAGHVRVYEYAGTTGSLAWTQRGADIDGVANEESGASISMNAAGNILAIGCPAYSTTISNVGRVRVFQWNTTTAAWQQLGNDIVGTVANAKTGTTVCLSSDGFFLAVCALNSPSSPTGNYGRVQAYWLDGATWQPIGNGLGGLTLGAEFGRSLAFNDSGSRLAVGAPNASPTLTNQGLVRIYDWDNTTSAWSFRAEILGTAAGDRAGSSVSLNGPGDTVVVGAPFNSGSGAAGSNRGHVRVFASTDGGGTTWAQVGTTLNGEFDSGRFGHAVAMNNAGDRVIVGAPFASASFSGYSFNAAADTVTRSAHGFVNGDALSFSSVTAAGVTANQTYYVINATANTFQLAATAVSTTPVNITADGSGTSVTPNSGFAYTYGSALGRQIARNQIRMSDAGVSIDNGATTPASALYVDTVNQRVGLGTTTPAVQLDINSNTLRLRTARTPASATATGNVGDICWDANYVYVCVAANSWRRAALTAW